MEYREAKWPWVLSGVLLVALLNISPVINQQIIDFDISAAIALNSIVGVHPVVDTTMAWLNSRLGDLAVLAFMCTLFLLHSFRGYSSREVIRRLSFWGWVALLCLLGYAVECGMERVCRREIPLAVLSQLKNVQLMYGISLRTSMASSFPSGHAIAYIFFALMAWSRYRLMSVLIWVIGLMMLSMRLIIGIHWFSDIVLGSTALSALLVCCAWETPLLAVRPAIESLLTTVFNRRSLSVARRWRFNPDLYSDSSRARLESEEPYAATKR